MTKLIQTRLFFEHAKSQLDHSSQADIAELDDWCLKDIGFGRRTPNLDAVKPFWMA